MTYQQSKNQQQNVNRITVLLFLYIFMNSNKKRVTLQTENKENNLYSLSKISDTSLNYKMTGKLIEKDNNYNPAEDRIKSLQNRNDELIRLHQIDKEKAKEQKMSLLKRVTKLEESNVDLENLKIQHEQEIQYLNGKLRESDKKISSLEAANARLQKVINSMKEDKQKQRERNTKSNFGIQVSDLQRSRIEEQLKKLKQLNKQLEEESDKKLSEVSSLSEEVRKLSQQLQEQKKKCTKLSTSVKHCEKLINELKRENVGVQQEVIIKDKKIEQLNEKVQQILSIKEVAEKEKSRQAKMIQQLKRQVERLKVDIKNKEVALNKQKQEIEVEGFKFSENEKLVEDLKKQVFENKLKIERLGEELRVNKQLLTQADDKIKSLQNKEIYYESKVSELEIAISKKDEQLYEMGRQKQKMQAKLQGLKRQKLSQNEEKMKLFKEQQAISSENENLIATIEEKEQKIRRLQEEVVSAENKATGWQNHSKKVAEGRDRIQQELSRLKIEYLQLIKFQNKQNEREKMIRCYQIEIKNKTEEFRVKEERMKQNFVKQLILEKQKVREHCNRNLEELITQYQQRLKQESIKYHQIVEEFNNMNVHYEKKVDIYTNQSANLIKKLEADVSSLNEQNKILQQQIQQLVYSSQQKNTLLSNQITQLHELVNKLSEEKLNLQEKLKAQDRELLQAKNLLKAEIQRTQEIIEESEAHREQYQKIVVLESKKNLQLQELVLVLKEKLYQMQADFEKSVYQLSSKIKATQEQKILKDEHYMEIENKYKVLQEQTNKYKSRCSAMQGQIDNINKEWIGKMRISEQQKQYLEIEISRWKQSRNKMLQENEDQKKQIRKLKTTLSQTQQQHKNFAIRLDLISKLQTKIEHLQQQNIKITNESVDKCNEVKKRYQGIMKEIEQQHKLEMDKITFKLQSQLSMKHRDEVVKLRRRSEQNIFTVNKYQMKIHEYEERVRNLVSQIEKERNQRLQELQRLERERIQQVRKEREKDSLALKHEKGLQRQIDELRVQRQKILKENLNLIEQVYNLKGKIKCYQQQFDDFGLKLKEKQTIIRDLTNQVKKLTSSVIYFQKQYLEVSQEMNHLYKDIEIQKKLNEESIHKSEQKISHSINIYQEEMKGMSSQCALLKGKIQQLNRKYEKQRKNSHQSSMNIKKYEYIIEEIKNDKQTLQKKIEELKMQRKKLESKVEEIGREKQKQQKKVEQLERQKKMAQMNLIDMQKQKEGMEKKKCQIEEAKERLQTKYEDSVRQRQKRDKKLIQIQKQSDRRRYEAEQLKKEKQRLEKKLEQLKKEAEREREKMRQEERQRQQQIEKEKLKYRQKQKMKQKEREKGKFNNSKQDFRQIQRQELLGKLSTLEKQLQDCKRQGKKYKKQIEKLEKQMLAKEGQNEQQFEVTLNKYKSQLQANLSILSIVIRQMNKPDNLLSRQEIRNQLKKQHSGSYGHFEEICLKIVDKISQLKEEIKKSKQDYMTIKQKLEKTAKQYRQYKQKKQKQYICQKRQSLDGMINSYKKLQKEVQSEQMKENYSLLYNKYLKYKEAFINCKSKLERYKIDVINDQRFTGEILQHCKNLIPKIQ